jgi:hypothetical protein
MTEHGLRRGDLVEVRSAREILTTLDADGALEAMPFMPEMIQYCGRRFTVFSRTDKVCDTINSNLSSRRLPDTVMLDGLRCDGSGHAGCQAECRLYWKEAWLRPVSPDDPPPVDGRDADAEDELRRLVAAHVDNGAEGDDRRYRCQATELVAASLSMSVADPRQYVRELTTRNIPVGTFVKVMARAAVMQPAQKVGLLPMPPVAGPDPTSPAFPPLDLEPGEWVRVKSREEIRATLNDKGKNRGLWFDREMLPFCGGVYQVRKRVTRIIDEPNGKMLVFTSDCIMLEDVVCSGERSTGRWFCKREIPCYWRECWLERAAPPATTSA